jgi:hypothetical protein
MKHNPNPNPNPTQLALKHTHAAVAVKFRCTLMAVSPKAVLPITLSTVEGGKTYFKLACPAGTGECVL